MTSFPPRRTPAGRSPLRIGVVILVALVGLAGAAGLAYLFLRAPAPAPVGGSTAGPGSSSGAIRTPSPLSSGAAGTLPADGLAGTWTIDQSIGSFADFTSSFVGYRVSETFADNRANTAVGRTPDVTGTLVLDATSITSVEIVANLTTLQSDDDRRDGRLRDQAIETGRFPNATFRLTTPISLDTLPADGTTVAATATGELTLHGVTNEVQIPVEARLSREVVTVTGSIDIRFDDYDIEQPTSFLVLSIEDHGIMEFQLHFRRD